MTDAVRRVKRCPLLPDATCPLTLLRRVIAERGHVTLRLADLDELPGGPGLGHTSFEDGVVDLHHDQTDGQWRASLLHELVHLLRGPAHATGAAIEERVVQRQTALQLVPIGPALGEIPRAWQSDELHEIAARAGVDPGTVRDAVMSPVVPAPRATVDA